MRSLQSSLQHTFTCQSDFAISAISNLVFSCAHRRFIERAQRTSTERSNKEQTVRTTQPLRLDSRANPSFNVSACETSVCNTMQLQQQWQHADCAALLAGRRLLLVCGRIDAGLGPTAFQVGLLLVVVVHAKQHKTTCRLLRVTCSLETSFKTVSPSSSLGGVCTQSLSDCPLSQLTWRRSDKRPRA